MFIGHYAVAFAAKRASPKVSLGVLVGAASLLDLLWAVILLLGWEAVRIEPGNTALVPLAFMHYPFSHNQLGSAPPSWQVVAWVGLAALLFPFWAEWFDRHRTR